MKKFIKMLEEIKENEFYETTGEALAHILDYADQTDYVDWRIMDLDEVAERIQAFYEL